MAREKDRSPRVALAPPESCDFSASTIATRTPERRTTRRHSDTFRNAIHSFQSFSGHTRKHGLAPPPHSLPLFILAAEIHFMEISSEEGQVYVDGSTASMD